MTPSQGSLELGAPVVDVAKVVDIVTAKVTELTIEIPEIIVLPTRQVTFGYRDFDLQGLESIARQPVSDQIMVQRLRDDARTYLARAVEGARPRSYSSEGAPPHAPPAPRRSASILSGDWISLTR
jgi:type III restriction enzyme